MDKQEIENRADKLVSQVEKGETDGLEKELNSMNPADRLAVARAMDRINDQHRQANSSLPDLVLDVQKDKFGHEYLADIQTTEERSVLNPLRYLAGERSSTDVYDQLFHERIQRTLEEQAKVIKDLKQVNEQIKNQ